MNLLKYLIFFISTNVMALDYFEVAPFNVAMKAPNVISKIESVIANPEGVLNRYTPIGGVIENKIVHQNEASFMMTKKVIIVSRTFNVHFSVAINEANNSCSNGQNGYNYVVNLEGSDSLVYDNIDRLEFVICLNPKDENNVNAAIKGKIYKGNFYSEPLGSIARTTIQEQVDPFVKAIRDEVQSK